MRRPPEQPTSTGPSGYLMLAAVLLLVVPLSLVAWAAGSVVAGKYEILSRLGSGGCSPALTCACAVADTRLTMSATLKNVLMDLPL